MRRKCHVSHTEICAHARHGSCRDGADRLGRGDASGLSAEDLQWSAIPSLPKGSEIAVLAGDPGTTGFFALRVRSPDGRVFAPHWHSQTEHVTVIEGTFHVGMGEEVDKAAATAVAAGGFFVMPAEMRHFGWVEGATVLQVSGMAPFDINYVKPEDDPSKQAAQ